MSELRHRQIIEWLERDGRVRVDAMVARFAVSSVTIRKDLAELEERGLLQRTHGGAAFVHTSRFNPSLQEKLQLHAKQKQAIAQAALEFIHNGEALILDGGSTVLALASVLKTRFKHLVIITPSIPVALELAETPWELILVGGQVRRHSLALVGPTAVANLTTYHADRAFLGATGMTLKEGFSTPNPMDAQLKQAMLAAADKTYVLTDSSKIGRPALVRYAQLNQVEAMVTDEAADADFLREARKQRLTVRLAK